MPDSARADWPLSFDVSKTQTLPRFNEANILSIVWLPGSWSILTICAIFERAASASTSPFPGFRADQLDDFFEIDSVALDVD